MAGIQKDRMDASDEKARLAQSMLEADQVMEFYGGREFNSVTNTLRNLIFLEGLGVRKKTDWLSSFRW